MDNSSQHFDQNTLHEEYDTNKARSGSRFGGFTMLQLVGGFMLLSSVVWAAWATREIMSLTDKRIVSVSLASMANDFVMTQARSGASPEQVEADTRHYMSALQAVLKDRSSKGETIIVSEAVVGGSVPDVTPDVRMAVGKIITQNPPPRLGATVPQQGVPSGQGLTPQPGLPATEAVQPSQLAPSGSELP